jgi:hypothetical protein
MQQHKYQRYPGAAVGGLAGVLSQLNTSSQSALAEVQDKASIRQMLLIH